MKKYFFYNKSFTLQRDFLTLQANLNEIGNNY